MIAFSIGGIDIYRYGIFYLVTFAVGYAFLRRLGSRKFFVSYPGVHTLLTQKLDDLFLAILLGVMLGGRLGHVFLYDRAYYSQHLTEILAFRQGGMSFVGGVIGVTVGISYLLRRQKLTKQELFLLGDIVLCIVPLGIFLGRIGNFLNQELVGKAIVDFPIVRQAIFQQLNLAYIYPLVDEQLRVNTNIIQSIGEGLFTGIIVRIIFARSYLHGNPKPGRISGIFLILYALVRFAAERLKDLPPSEIIGPLSVTQRIMIIFLVFGSRLIRQSKKSVI